MTAALLEVVVRIYHPSWPVQSIHLPLLMSHYPPRRRYIRHMPLCRFVSDQVFTGDLFGSLCSNESKAGGRFGVRNKRGGDVG